jgi:DNA mismatch repair protein MSH2
VNGDFEEQQRYVVSEISEIACGYAPHFATIGHLVAHLDCLVGFAVAAVLAPVPYCRPKICDRDQGTIKLVEARHPCLEMLDNMTFIPNNMTFDKVYYIYRVFLHVV